VAILSIHSKPLDVVVAEVVAGLGFHDDEGFLSGVPEQVGGLGRHGETRAGDENRLHPVHGNRGRSLHDGPVLFPALVPMQAQALPAFDLDPPYLAALLLVEDDVPAPGPLHAGKALGEFRPQLLQPVDHLLHLLARAALGDQEGVGAFDDEETLHVDQGYLPVSVDHEVVVAVDQYRIIDSREGVAALGTLQFLVDRVEAAEVAPADIAGHDGDRVRFFHHGVVDADGRYLVHVFRAGGEGPFRLGLSVGFDGSSPYLGSVDLELVEELPGREAEHARVPPEVSRGEVAFGGLGVGLFLEAQDLFARSLDVAEAGIGTHRPYSERDDLPLFGELHRAGDGLPVGLGLRDKVIAWRHENHLVPLQHHAGKGDGRSRVPSLGLDHGFPLVDADLPELVRGEEGLVPVRRDEEPFGEGKVPFHRRLEEGVSGKDAGELLRKMGAAQGPEPRPDPAAENDVRHDAP
jgi:hypothetical protein